MYGDDPAANHFNQSYVQDFIDISGNVVLQKDADLNVHNNIITAGNVTIDHTQTHSGDVTTNKQISVDGDISLNANVTVNNNVSMDGNIVKCNLAESSIPSTAINGVITTGPDFTQPTILYEKGVNVDADVSLNGTTVQASNLKIDGNIEFSDGTIMDTYDDNKVNGSYPSSTFESLVINNTLTAGSFSTSSDYRIKKNIVSLNETNTIDTLRPVKYLQTLINKEQYGLIAHELQEYYPDLVVGEKDGEDWQRINYTGLIAILINEIKRLKKEMIELENMVHSKMI